MNTDKITEGTNENLNEDVVAITDKGSQSSINMLMITSGERFGGAANYEGFGYDEDEGNYKGPG